MYSGDVVDSVQATRDASLVRDDRDGDTCPVESGYRFRRPVDEFDAIDGAHLAMVNDDRAVTIEKDPGPQTRVPCPTVTIGHATFTVSPHIAVTCLRELAYQSAERAVLIRKPQGYDRAQTQVTPRREAVGAAQDVTLGGRGTIEQSRGYQGRAVTAPI